MLFAALAYSAKVRTDVLDFLRSGRVAYLILMGLALMLLGLLCLIGSFDSQEARVAEGGMINQLVAASSSKQFQSATFLLSGGLAVISITSLPIIEVVF